MYLDYNYKRKKKEYIFDGFQAFFEIRFNQNQQRTTIIFLKVRSKSTGEFDNKTKRQKVFRFLEQGIFD